MNRYDEKAQHMRQHLNNHPADYQTVISLFKTESDSIAFEQQKKRNLMKAEIAKYKKVGETIGKQA